GCVLQDPVLVARAGALVVLLRRDSEQDHGGDPEAGELVGLAHEIVHRAAAQGGQQLVGARVRADEQREHELLRVDPRLPHEGAQRGRAAQAAEPRLGERAHANSLRTPRRASAPKTAVRSASHSSSRPTARHGVASYSAEPNSFTACANGKSALTQPATGTISGGTSPMKTMGRTTRMAISEAVRASRASVPSRAPSAPTAAPAATRPTA